MTLLDRKIAEYLERHPEAKKFDRFGLAMDAYEETFSLSSCDLPGTFDVANRDVILDFIAYCFEQGKPFSETERGKAWDEEYKKMLDDGVLL